MSDLDIEFYDERLLPLPDHEYRPESAAELREVVEGEGGVDPEHSLVVLGGGEHLRSSAIGERRFDVVRTEACNRVRAVDRESNTIRVEAGVTWGELREAAAAEQRALHRYRLHPEGATIGGLLGRWQPLERQLHRGDLRAGCIATRTASPGGAGYDYLPAPRKASGPDHRFLYIGGEGGLGVVLEATLVLAPQQPGALLEWEAPEVADAVEWFRVLDRFDVRPSWCRWAASEQVFEAALYGPADLLDAWLERLGSEAGSPEVTRGEAVDERRLELEREHPGARSTSGANERERVVWPLSELSDAVDALVDEVDEVTILDWGPHRAAAYIEPDEDVDTSVAALARQSVVDEGESVWPAWVQRLKARLDPEGRLAVGP